MLQWMAFLCKLFLFLKKKGTKMHKINWKKVIGWGIMAAIIGCLIYFNKPQEKKEKDFIARYTKTYGLEPTYTSAYGYDTGRLIVKAWVKSGKVTPETLIAQIPYDGVTAKPNVSAAIDSLKCKGGCYEKIINDDAACPFGPGLYRLRHEPGSLRLADERYSAPSGSHQHRR